MNQLNSTKNDSQFQIVVNDEVHLVDQGATIGDLVLQLKLGSAVAVEVNGALITRDIHHSFKIPARAKIEIVTLAGGG